MRTIWYAKPLSCRAPGVEAMHCANTASCSATSSHYRSHTMTDPTGRSFLSYRRLRSGEAALLIEAQHDHGIPTWQDTKNLGTVPTEDEIRRTLADPSTASAVLFVTPEVEQSPIIRNVEIPKIVQRAEADDGFLSCRWPPVVLTTAKPQMSAATICRPKAWPTGTCTRLPTLRSCAVCCHHSPARAGAADAGAAPPFGSRRSSAYRPVHARDRPSNPERR